MCAHFILKKVNGKTLIFDIMDRSFLTSTELITNQQLDRCRKKIEGYTQDTNVQPYQRMTDGNRPCSVVLIFKTTTKKI